MDTYTGQRSSAARSRSIQVEDVRAASTPVDARVHSSSTLSYASIAFSTFIAKGYV